jgi:hypothetical protein
MCFIRRLEYYLQMLRGGTKVDGPSKSMPSWDSSILEDRSISRFGKGTPYDASVVAIRSGDK